MVGDGGDPLELFADLDHVGQRLSRQHPRLDALVLLRQPDLRCKQIKVRQDLARRSCQVAEHKLYHTYVHFL